MFFQNILKLLWLLYVTLILDPESLIKKLMKNKGIIDEILENKKHEIANKIITNKRQILKVYIINFFTNPD